MRLLPVLALLFPAILRAATQLGSIPLTNTVYTAADVDRLLSAYATTGYVSDAIISIPAHDLSAYATTGYVASLISELPPSLPQDLSAYVTTNDIAVSTIAATNYTDAAALAATNYTDAAALAATNYTDYSISLLSSASFSDLGIVATNAVFSFSNSPNPGGGSGDSWPAAYSTNFVVAIPSNSFVYCVRFRESPSQPLFLRPDENTSVVVSIGGLSETLISPELSGTPFFLPVFSFFPGGTNATLTINGPSSLGSYPEAYFVARFRFSVSYLTFPPLEE